MLLYLKQQVLDSSSFVDSNLSCEIIIISEIILYTVNVLSKMREVDNEVVGSWHVTVMLTNAKLFTIASAMVVWPLGKT